MRAVRLHGPNDVRVDEIAAPDVEPKMVLLEVEACGICGSDVHFVDGTARTDHVPITLGHEIAGRVLAGPAESLPVGTPVVAEVGRFCLACPHCVEGRPNLCSRARVLGIHVDGGLAEQVAVPASSVIRRPDSVPAEVAATAVDAGATALHAIRRRAAIRPGETVLVIGAGGLGSYGIQFARLEGAGAIVVADTDPASLERARSLGADEVIHIEDAVSTGRTVKLLTDGGVDAAVEFVGAARSVQDAIKSLRPGGRAVVVGVGVEPITTLPAVLWSNNEYTLTGSYGSLPGDAAAVLELLAAGTLAAPPTWDVPLDNAPGVLEALARGDRPGSGRAVVRP